jgi:hypothetical protein
MLPGAMGFLLFVLSLLLLAALLLGLVSPRLVLPGAPERRSRKRVLLVYGGSALAAFIVAMALAPPSGTGARQPDKAAAPPPPSGAPAGTFVGKIVWVVHSSSASNPAGARQFAQGAERKVTMLYGSRALGLQIEGGFSEGAYRLDPAARKAFIRAPGQPEQPALLADLDAADPAVRALLPRQFAVELEKTGQTATIAGLPCERYLLKKSGFTRGPTTACITEAILPRRARFQIETETRRIVSPLPLTMPLEKGAILEIATSDQGVDATWTASEVIAGEPADPLLQPLP